MKINVDQLEIVVAKLLENARKLGIDEVEIKEDYYWHVQKVDLYNVYKQPHELTIGSLSEDWAHLAAIAQDGDKAIPHALIWEIQGHHTYSASQNKYDVPVIPDLGGHKAKEGTPHDTGERNVNPNEEHSVRPKGNPTKRPGG
jgi:hypothetical protein